MRSSSDVLFNAFQLSNQQLIANSFREGYKAKCSQYWPDEVGSELKTEELTVTMKFVRDDVLYVTRSFLVTDKETEQTVCTLLFKLNDI